jgi:hypothetical protein
MTRLSAAVLLASIREATAAWNAEQDTAYYAEKHGYETQVEMWLMLNSLAVQGKVTRTTRRAWGATYYTWRVNDER